MNKYDTEANWSKATFTPLKGELIIYAPDEVHQYERFKVGDGVTTIGELPFTLISTINGVAPDENGNVEIDTNSCTNIINGNETDSIVQIVSESAPIRTEINFGDLSLGNSGGTLLEDIDKPTEVASIETSGWCLNLIETDEAVANHAGTAVLLNSELNVAFDGNYTFALDINSSEEANCVLYVDLEDAVFKTYEDAGFGKAICDVYVNDEYLKSIDASKVPDGSTESVRFTVGVSKFLKGVNVVKFVCTNYTDGDSAKLLTIDSITIRGQTSILTGHSAVAFGRYNEVSGYSAVAIGYNNNVSGSYAFACNHSNNVAEVDGFACNANNSVLGEYSFASGYSTTSSGFVSHSEGRETIASGDHSHAEGYLTKAESNNTHAEGFQTTASEKYAHSEGYKTVSSALATHSEGYETTASGNYSHSEGYNTIASLECSHSEGKRTEASGEISHAEGYMTKASGYASHAEGSSTVASGQHSHAEGSGTTASGMRSHAEGQGTVANGRWAHAQGSGTTASGDCAHSEGKNTNALKICTHAEGNGTTASAEAAHAEGKDTMATAAYSHAGGLGTKANQQAQTAIGMYNATDANALLIVGNGVDDSNRGNAFTVNKDGSITVNGINFTSELISKLITISTDEWREELKNELKTELKTELKEELKNEILASIPSFQNGNEVAY